MTISEPAPQTSKLVNAVADPDCYTEKLKGRKDAVGKMLGRAKNVVDLLSIAQKIATGNGVGVATDVLDKKGAGFDIDAGGGFKFKINGGVMNAVVANLTPLATRRLALTAAGPVGIAILGVGVAIDIAIIVNDAFGEDILRALDKRTGRGPKPPVAKPSEDLDVYSGGKATGGSSGLSKAGSTGDPHMRTHDNVAYTFHATGDFVLTQDAKDGFEIQTRQEPFKSVCSGIAVNTRMAIRLGKDRLEYDGSWFLNGAPMTVYEDGVVLNAGRLTKVGKKFILTTLQGDMVMVQGTSSISVSVGINPRRAGRMRGLLGDGDGIQTQQDEFVLANGQPISGDTIPWKQMTGPFADAWRVTADTSLFSYEEQKGPQDFIVPGYPDRPTTLEDFEASVVAMARQVCTDAGVGGEDVLGECTLDAICSGPEVIGEVLEAHQGREEPEARAKVEYPIFLDGWTQEGVSSAGTWEIAADGLSVVQTTNGDPTFFVSPNDYDNHTIFGSWDVSSSDDDYIGFVFGYNGPFVSAGDDPNQLNSLLPLMERADSGGST